MSKPLRRLFLLAVFLAAGACILSQFKYIVPWALYQRNKAAFHLFSVQLEAMLRETEQEEPWGEGTSDPHIQLYLRDGQITSLMVRKQRQDPEGYPSLAETAPALCEAGVFHIEVYDFSRGGGDQQTGSPCEIWYSARGEGHLVYSASGSLTYSHDPGNSGWGGYRFYQKRLDQNWFVMVSRYDEDSPYWRM